MFVKLFGKSIAGLEKALDIRSNRHAIITGNIVNQDTPDYHAKEIDFKKAMAEAMSGGQSIPVSKTHGAHIEIGSSANVTPRVTRSASSGIKRLDGNTVNAEQEMAKLAENTLMYQATAQFIAAKFQDLKSVIREGQ